MTFEVSGNVAKIDGKQGKYSSALAEGDELVLMSPSGGG